MEKIARRFVIRFDYPGNVSTFLAILEMDHGYVWWGGECTTREAAIISLYEQRDCAIARGEDPAPFGLEGFYQHINRPSTLVEVQEVIAIDSVLTRIRADLAKRV